MQIFRSLSILSFLFLGIIGLSSCDKPANSTTASPSSSTPSSSAALEVYKSSTCGCCQMWVEHAQANGFEPTIHNTEDLNEVKARFGIARKYQSCHTSVSSDGYIFEGHIPARLIKQFLADKPADALGLAVPGMPIGSPGMEMGDRITPYDVLLLKKDGTSSVYARVSALE
ncbi:DUF411 domain-containing protein [Saccharophagus sp. K07]|jgi:hypothetical protein|uniref:DUF411 domain-containing protein n=1 Tax=Saccharophagus sp. K07 TaxID=2283636 RepID=UPI00165256B6|nr:DUF411 domain-containing protein [Saccharophagus sp. K07]MBC6904990.1 DUF411 domain-containing protein [Saccharophagus sp. K07]